MKQIQKSYKHQLPMDILSDMGEKMNFNFLCNVSPTDSTNSYLNFDTDNSVSSTLKKFANSTQRNIHNFDNLILFRTNNWYFNTKDETRQFRNLSQKWTTEGTLEIKNIKQESNLPAHTLDIYGKWIPVDSFCREISQASGWEISVSPELGKRRIYICAKNVSPGTICDALSFMLNARETITIGQTNRQKQYEEDLIKQDDSRLTDREKMSRELRKDLEKLLTPEQKKKMQQEEVGIKLSDIPSELRGKVDKYIYYLANRPGGSNPSIDFSRLNQFEIVFLPPQNAPGGALGVNGWTNIGMPIGF